MKLYQFVILGMLLVAPWIWNGVKFIGCDFESDYRCEVIHGIGVVVPPAAYITVWFAGEDD